MFKSIYTKRNYFFLYQGEKHSYSSAKTSIFNEDTGKKKRFIGLINSYFWYYIKTIFFIIISLAINEIKAQEKEWQTVSSPIFSDLKNIQFISKDSAYISGKQLLLLTENKCEKFIKQPPCEISNMFAINSNSIFVSNNTSYQESDLFYWNGKNWAKIYNPTANNISDMCFMDSQNGFLSSYGEIVQLIDGHWYPMNLPTNRAVSKLIKIEKELIALFIGKGIYIYTDKWTFIKNSKNSHNLSKINDQIYTLGNDFLGVIQSDSIRVVSKNPIWNKIQSITKNTDGAIIGVGLDGKIIKFLDDEIRNLENDQPQDLHKIITHDNNLWCIGQEGIILKYTSEKLDNNLNTWKGFETIVFNKSAKIVDDEYGVIAADFNKDGLTDIFTCGLFEEEHLYINKSNFVFNEQSKAFQLNKANKSIKELHLGACAGDIDNDGYIDLYLGVLNGKNKLYKNINGTHFIDYSSNARGISESTDRTNACIMGDVDNDGDLDIFIVNEYSSNRLFINNGVGIFSEITQTAHLETEEGGSSASFADIDNDGDIDLFVANWSLKNVLYQNQFIQTGKVEFINKTQEANVGGKSYAKSNAVVFSDIDNDGDLDLFVTNRKTSNRLYYNDGAGIFKDKTEDLLGLDKDRSYGAVIADFDGDSYKDIYVSNVGENIFYKNNKGLFHKETQKYGASILGYSTGSALADFDNNGSLDMYIANYVGSSSALLRNKKANNNFIRLQISSYQNNHNAIGAKIFVYNQESPPKLLWFDEIRTGSGYVSQNEFEKVISIQDNPKVNIKIMFPNGVVIKRASVISGSTVHISDTEGFVRYYFKFRRLVKRMLFDPHNLFELIKWVFILFLIGISGFYQFKKHHWNLWLFLGGILLFISLYYIQFQQFQYSPFLFSTFLPLSSILIGVLLTYYYFERRYIKRESEFEKKKIRKKLSRDLHDDLAATVSSIGFYQTLMKFEIKESNPKILSFIQKSEELVADATNAITDMIWSVNPKNETLKSLLLRIQKNYQVLFNENNIKLIIPIKSVILERQLDDTAKQNIYLILKEALNNVLKYAQATTVEIKVNKKDKQIELVVRDNGKGFDYALAKDKGNGLTNMYKRAEEMQASLEIISKIQEGTTIKIVF